MTGHHHSCHLRAPAVRSTFKQIKCGWAQDSELAGGLPFCLLTVEVAHDI
jgi:hypothetical protein